MLQDSFKLDRFFKLLNIKQSLVQVEQLEKQTDFFESMANAQSKVDSNMLNDFMSNNSIKDLMDKLTKE